MIGLEEFKATGSEWSVDKIEQWLREGAAALSDESDERRVLAFPPLLLDEQADAADQILSAINKLPQAAYHRACAALTRLLHGLPTRASPTFVEFFFKLAGTLRPRGLAEILRDFLQRQIVHDDISSWTGPIRTGIIAVCDYPYSEQLDDLISDLRPTQVWSPMLARHYILARLRARPRDWLTVLDQCEADLRDLQNQQHNQFSLLLRQMAKTVGPRLIEKDLPELIYGDLDRLRWIADELIGGEGPLTVDADFKIRVGSAAAPLNTILCRDLPDEQQMRFMTYILGKRSISSLSSADSKKRILDNLPADVEVAA